MRLISHNRRRLRRFMTDAFGRLVCALAIKGFVLLNLVACAKEEPTEAQRKQCFDSYIREHQAEYPVDTLKKTAALKCYS